MSWIVIFILVLLGHLITLSALNKPKKNYSIKINQLSHGYAPPSRKKSQKKSVTSIKNANDSLKQGQSNEASDDNQSDLNAEQKFSVERITPPFPKEAIEQNIEGKVIVEIEFSKITNKIIKINFKSGHDIFKESITNAVFKWNIHIDWNEIPANKIEELSNHEMGIKWIEEFNFKFNDH